MARRQRELWANLQHPQWGGPVMPVQVVLTPGTTSAESVIWVAPRNVAIRRARVAARADLGAATATAVLENVTDTEDLSSSFDLSTLGGNATGEFTLNSNADFIEEGDVLTVDYESTVDPGELVIVLEVEYLELKNS